MAGATTVAGTGAAQGNNFCTMADKPKATNPVNAMVSGEERERGDKDMVKTSKNSKRKIGSNGFSCWKEFVTIRTEWNDQLLDRQTQSKQLRDFCRYTSNWRTFHRDKGGNVQICEEDRPVVKIES